MLSRIDPLRKKVVVEAEWGIANAPDIHYTEDTRRNDWLRTVKNRADLLPLYTDCSGFFTLCYWLAGCINELGLGPKEVGYTGTLLQYGKNVVDPLPGDAIIYGPGTGHHVVMFLRKWHGAWIVASHGDEHGPVMEMQHREAIVQPNPIHIRSYLPR